MSNNIIVAFIFSVLFGCQAQNTNIKILEPEVFKTQITDNSVQLIDVRTANEFESGHIKNATNIDFLSSDFSDNISKLNKEQPIYIYCKSGNRSLKASKILVELGFTEIYDLEGGFLNWKE